MRVTLKSKIANKNGILFLLSTSVYALFFIYSCFFTGFSFAILITYLAFTISVVFIMLGLKKGNINEVYIATFSIMAFFAVFESSSSIRELILNKGFNSDEIGIISSLISSVFLGTSAITFIFYYDKNNNCLHRLLKISMLISIAFLIPVFVTKIIAISPVIITKWFELLKILFLVLSHLIFSNAIQYVSNKKQITKEIKV